MATGSARAPLLFAACLALFALGTLTTYQVLATAVRLIRMGAWPTVPATLDAVELHHPGGGAARSLSVSARYHYVIDGRSYTGSQVSVYRPDSIGSFFQRTYADLQGRLQRHEPVPVHVNPAAPTDSIIVTVFRPELLAFQVVLIVIGFGGGTWAWAHRRRRSEATAGSVAVPGTSAARPAAARASAAVAWGHRLVLAGILMAAGDYLLLEHSRDDAYTLLDRILAAQVSVSGTVFVSPPDDRVPALVRDVAPELGGDARVIVESRSAQDVKYTVRVERSSRAEALDALARLLSSLQVRYRDASGHDLTTFADPYAAPVVTARARSIASAIIAGLGLIAVCCIGAGMRLIRRSRIAPA